MKLALALACAILSSSVLASNKIINPISGLTHPASVSLKSWGGQCTGSLVGLWPPTVITAKHCHEMGVSEFEGKSPVRIVGEAFGDERFSPYSVLLPGDVVVYIYPDSLRKKLLTKVTDKDLFAVDFSETVSAGEDIWFCGYGYTNAHRPGYTGLGEGRCGKNKAILEDPKLDFSKEVERFKKIRPESEFTAEMWDEMIHSQIQWWLRQYGAGTRVAFASFEKSNSSLVNQGDSGGPTFQKKNNRDVLVGVNSLSLTRTFDGKFIGSLSWRLDHPWSRELLQKAIDEGADIKGLRKGAFATLQGPVELDRQVAIGRTLTLSAEVGVIGSKAGKVATSVRIRTISPNLRFAPEVTGTLDINADSRINVRLGTVSVSPAAQEGESYEVSGEVILREDLTGKETAEEFSLYGRVLVNSDAAIGVAFNQSPRKKKGTIKISLTPKYSQLRAPYTVEVKAPESMAFKETMVTGKNLKQGKREVLKLTYELAPEARGQALSLKLIVKSDGEVVEERALEIYPK